MHANKELPVATTTISGGTESRENLRQLKERSQRNQNLRTEQNLTQNSNHQDSQQRIDTGESEVTNRLNRFQQTNITTQQAHQASDRFTETLKKQALGTKTADLIQESLEGSERSLQIPQSRNMGKIMKNPQNLQMTNPGLDRYDMRDSVSQMSVVNSTNKNNTQKSSQKLIKQVKNNETLQASLKEHQKQKRLKNIPQYKLTQRYDNLREPSQLDIKGINAMLQISEHNANNNGQDNQSQRRKRVQKLSSTKLSGAGSHTQKQNLSLKVSSATISHEEGLPLADTARHDSQDTLEKDTLGSSFRVASHIAQENLSQRRQIESDFIRTELNDSTFDKRESTNTHGVKVIIRKLNKERSQQRTGRAADQSENNSVSKYSANQDNSQDPNSSLRRKRVLQIPRNKIKMAVDSKQLLESPPLNSQINNNSSFEQVHTIPDEQGCQLLTCTSPELPSNRRLKDQTTENSQASKDQLKPDTFNNNLGGLNVTALNRYDDDGDQTLQEKINPRKVLSRREVKHAVSTINSNTLNTEKLQQKSIPQVRNIDQVDNSICQLSESSQLVTRVNQPSEFQIQQVQVRDQSRKRMRQDIASILNKRKHSNLRAAQSNLRVQHESYSSVNFAGVENSINNDLPLEKGVTGLNNDQTQDPPPQIGLIRIDEQQQSKYNTLDSKRVYKTPGRLQGSMEKTQINQIESDQLDKIRVHNNTEKRSFSIQPQYKSNLRAKLDFSRGNSRDQSQHKTSQFRDGLDASVYSTGLNQSIYSKRKESQHESSENSQGGFGKRIPFAAHSGFNREASNDADSLINNQSPTKVPGIMMDSINSQQLRSKSFYRGREEIFNTQNGKFTSLQTLAFTSDQAGSYLGAETTGLGSINIKNMQKRTTIGQTKPVNLDSSSAYQNRKNIDRSALLEEIEKNKIEETKLKTFKNIDKYNKAQPRQLISNNAPLSASKNTSEMNRTLTTKFSKASQNQNMVEADSLNKSRGAINQSIQNSKLQGRDHSPQIRLKLNPSRQDSSPIYVQVNSQGEDASPVNKRPALNYTREALIKLKESMDHISSESAMSWNKFKQNQPGEAKSQLKNSPSLHQKNTINLAKLSLALKNSKALGGPLQRQNTHSEGVQGSSIPQTLSQFQKEDFSSIANILNATLSKLKKPNKHFLTPLDQSVIKASQMDTGISKIPLLKKSNNNILAAEIPVGPSKSLRNMMLGSQKRQTLDKTPDNPLSPDKLPFDSNMQLVESVAMTPVELEDNKSAADKEKETTNGPQDGDGGSDEEQDLELNLDELTQEDKFYLIQQIEEVQKNIRYYSSNQETYVFQDFEEQDGGDGKPQNSRYEDKDADTGAKATSTNELENSSPLVSNKNSMKEGAGASQGKIKGQQQSSPSAKNNSIGFVTSALGLQPHDSLEIIEDADEIEEDELDNIQICDHSPIRRKQSGNPTSIDQQNSNFTSKAPFCAEPTVPMANQPFQGRNKRRVLAEGQKQILSKGELKRYKGEEDNSSDGGGDAKGSDLKDEPEETSQIMVVQRRSKIAKDADVLRFSRASSLDQNFLLEVEGESKMQNTISKIRLEHSQSPTVLQNERDSTTRACEPMNESQVNYLNQLNGSISPMSLRKTPNQLTTRATMVSMRRLTNSLFDEYHQPFQNPEVIQEEDQMDQNIDAD